MQTIGQRLKAVREEKELTLEKVFQAIRIRVNYLQALEDDDFSSMPSPVQARGYLRNYAEFLGLDLDQLLEEVRISQQSGERIISPVDSTTQPATPTPQPDSAQQAAPLPPPTVEPVQEAEPQPFDGADSATQDKPEPEPIKPKRRGRKKVEPEPVPEIEAKPEVVEEPLPQPAPVVDEIPEPKQEEPPQQPDSTDSLWQIWLNRISSVISKRPGRKSELASKESEGTDQAEVTTVQPEPTPAEVQPSTFDSPNLQPSNLQLSEQIFKEIGADLRNRRETLSLHLEEVERNTHVKAHYLEALELGALDRLPSTVQTRGMLSNYASFLDMDVDAVLLRFADALQASHRERNPQKPARKTGQPILANMPALRNFLAGDMIFGVGMAVLLVGFVFWGINRVLTLQSLEDIQPTAPSISDVLLASPDPSLFTATPTLLPVEGFAEEATPTIIIPTVNVNVSVQVNLVAVERTYVRVIVDGEVAFEGRVIPGNAYLYEAEEQVEVLVGSGAAVRIAYNGRDLGLMGTFGQIVNNIYRADAILTPTALPSPTPTNTVPPSPTLRPTNTPVSSRTPVPSSTPVP